MVDNLQPKNKGATTAVGVCSFSVWAILRAPRLHGMTEQQPKDSARRRAASLTPLSMSPCTKFVEQQAPATVAAAKRALSSRAPQYDEFSGRRLVEVQKLRDYVVVVVRHQTIKSQEASNWRPVLPLCAKLDRRPTGSSASAWREADGLERGCTEADGWWPMRRQLENRRRKSTQRAVGWICTTVGDRRHHRAPRPHPMTTRKGLRGGRD